VAKREWRRGYRNQKERGEKVNIKGVVTE